MGPAKAPLSKALPRIFVPLTFDPMMPGRKTRNSSARSSKLPSPRSAMPSASTSTAADRTVPLIFAIRSAKVAAMSTDVTGDKARMSKPSAINFAGAAVPSTVKVPSRADSLRSATSSDAICAVSAPSHLRQLPRPDRFTLIGCSRRNSPATKPFAGASSFKSTSKRLSSGTASSFKTIRSPRMLPAVVLITARLSAICTLPDSDAICSSPVMLLAKTMRSTCNRSILISISGSNGSPRSGIIRNAGSRDTFNSLAVSALMATPRLK